jgi:cytochrome P450
VSGTASVQALSSLDRQLTALFAGDQTALRERYPLYERLRDESPVHRFGTGTVILTRYADVKAAFLDPRRFPSAAERIIKFDETFSLLTEAELELYREMVEFERLFISRQNADTHRRYRAAAQRAFTPRRMAELRASIQSYVDDQLDRLAAAGTGDWMELAYRVPLLVITSLLGAPLEDADRIKAWGDAVLAPSARVPMEPDVLRDAHRRLGEYREYAGELIERNRAAGDRTGVVALLLDAEADDRLSPEELIATFLHLLFAGHETTTNLIGNGLLALMAHPDQWDLLRAEPGLVTTAVEEILRYDAPVHFSGRVAGEDVELGGVELTAGTAVVLGDAAANRDGAAFEDADRFDIARRPNDHLSLGHGVHFCLGAPLARLEGQIVFSTLARRFPEVELAADPDGLEWVAKVTHRGVVELPVTLGPVKLGPERRS